MAVHHGCLLFYADISYSQIRYQHQPSLPFPAPHYRQSIHGLPFPATESNGFFARRLLALVFLQVTLAQA
ncbi:hypothetical protein ABTK15_20555, partial [Acinetobacter baumannii]